MTNTTPSPTTPSPTNGEVSPSGFPAPEPGDPRHVFAAATAAVGSVLAVVPEASHTAATPCGDFTVEDLQQHIVLVMRRVAAIGNGDHWSTVTEEPTTDGWHADFTAAAHDVMHAWADPSKLERDYEVPWGTVPGVPMILSYVGELATHGWDLATAIGVPFELDDDLLRPALEVAQFGLPADQRNGEVPFGPVIDAGPEAPVLLELVGWFGHPIDWKPAT